MCNKIKLFKERKVVKVGVWKPVCVLKLPKMIQRHYASNFNFLYVLTWFSFLTVFIPLWAAGWRVVLSCCRALATRESLDFDVVKGIME